MPAHDAATAAALGRAKARLDRLDLYPHSVRLEPVRVRVTPWFFRLPRLRRYDGYALKRTILLRRPAAEMPDDLITHELCHIWQQQHRRWQAVWAWATKRYDENPFEQEARRAVEATRE
jgi:hypothetical protein